MDYLLFLNMSNTVLPQPITPSFLPQYDSASVFPFPQLGSPESHLVTPSLPWLLLELQLALPVTQ